MTAQPPVRKDHFAGKDDRPVLAQQSGFDDWQAMSYPDYTYGPRTRRTQMRIIARPLMMKLGVERREQCLSLMNATENQAFPMRTSKMGKPDTLNQANKSTSASLDCCTIAS